MFCKRFVLLISLLICGSLSMHREMLNLIETQKSKDQFKLWHYALQKPYDLNSDAALQKYKVFKANLKFIRNQNAMTSDYQLGLGPFTDLTWEEFKEAYLHDRKVENNQSAQFEPRFDFDELADEEEEKSQNLNQNEYQVISKSWKGFLNYSKDQLNCGGCWAFSVVLTIEYLNLIKNKAHVKYSVQQLLDCDTSNSGCNGGFPHGAFNYAAANGLVLEQDYQFINGVGRCKASSKPIAIKISGYKYCAKYMNKNCKIEDLLAIIEKGPYSAGIKVNDGLQHYKQGDWVDKVCDMPNHQVVVLQINLKRRSNYYHEGEVAIKNSWGRYWGVNGEGSVKCTSTQIDKCCGLTEEAFVPELN